MLNSVPNILPLLRNTNLKGMSTHEHVNKHAEKAVRRDSSHFTEVKASKLLLSQVAKMAPTVAGHVDTMVITGTKWHFVSVVFFPKPKHEKNTRLILNEGCFLKYLAITAQNCQGH